MKWLTSNLYILVVLGLVLFFGSFVRMCFVKPQWLVCGIGSFLLVLAICGAVYVILAPPVGEKTDIITPNNGPKPDFPKTAIERLRLAWDSEKREADWPASETLAVISDTAYLPPVEAQRKFLELGFTEFMPVVAGSMIGYVVSGGDVTVVAFRGTDFDEVSDWIANLGVSATDTPHGPIHSGFNNAYFSMKPQIEQILAERDTKHLWITGHSLGGAIAVVCAYDFIENDGHQIDGTMSFGQPMVARAQLAKYIDQLLVGRFARFVNGRDLVPRIPPSHAPCGSLVWLTNNGIERSKPKQMLFGASIPKDVIPAEGTEIEPLSDEEFTRLQAELKAESNVPQRLPDGTPMYQGKSRVIEDHSMSLYLDKIRSHLGLESSE